MNKDINNKNDVWCAVQEIPHNTVFCFSLIYYMINGWPERGFGDKLKLFIAHFKGEDSKLYCNENEFDQEAKYVANQIINNPDWAIKELSKVKNWSRRFIESSQKLYSLDYSSTDLKKILEQYKKTTKYFSLSQANGAALTWLTETRQEYIAKESIEIIKTQIVQNRLSNNVTDVFNILTSTNEESFVAMEERELLKIAQEITKNDLIRNLFFEKNVTDLNKIISAGSNKKFKKIFNHHIKWQWLSFGYRGPALDLNYFLNRLQSFIKGSVLPKDIIDNNDKKIINLKKKQKELLAKLKLTDYQSSLIKFTQLSSHIKDYRKGAMYYAMFCYEHLFQHIASKTSVDIGSVWSMYAYEIEDYLSGKSIPAKEVLLERQKECTILIDRYKYEIIVGKRVSNILDPILNKLLINNKRITEIHGTSVCSGHAKGIVKIIEKIEDMKRMNIGDVLISHITYPSLVPAMKKASAIITNVGGVICHAAIIARELNIPCIVGTKFATHVLKDGDLVEVDANKGVVRIIKRAK